MKLFESKHAVFVFCVYFLTLRKGTLSYLQKKKLKSNLSNEDSQQLRIKSKRVLHFCRKEVCAQQFEWFTWLVGLRAEVPATRSQHICAPKAVHS